MTESKERRRREFSARLQRAADYRGLPEHGKASYLSAAFAQRGITMSSMSVGRWFNASTMPASTNLQILAEILNINPDWLISGRGNMVTTEATTPNGETVNVVLNELPKLSVDQVQDWLNDALTVQRDIIVAGSVSAKAFVIALPDYSLAPRFTKGTLLVVDPGHKLDPELPALALQDGLALFGYPVPRPESVMLESPNRDYGSTTVPRSHLIGPVVAIAQLFLKSHH